MNAHISTQELANAGLSTREALIGSYILAIHEIVERAIARPSHDPAGSISDQVARDILGMTNMVIDLLLGRKPFRNADVSRLKLISKLAKLEAPANMSMYPTRGHIDDNQQYCEAVAKLAQEHIKEVAKDLPNSPGDSLDGILTDALADMFDSPWDANRRWCDDVTEHGYERQAAE